MALMGLSARGSEGACTQLCEPLSKQDRFVCHAIAPAPPFRASTRQARHDGPPGAGAAGEALPVARDALRRGRSAGGGRLQPAAGVCVPGAHARRGRRDRAREGAAPARGHAHLRPAGARPRCTRGAACTSRQGVTAPSMAAPCGATACTGARAPRKAAPAPGASHGSRTWARPC